MVSDMLMAGSTSGSQEKDADGDLAGHVHGELTAISKQLRGVVLSRRQSAAL